MPYNINKAGEIGHFLPDHEKMLELGVEGYLRLMEGKESPLYEAAASPLDGLAIFANRLADEA